MLRLLGKSWKGKKEEARELCEECGLQAEEANLDYAACLDFIFPDNPAWSQQVHVFRLWRWQGAPAESAEMRPLWFKRDASPYKRMWDDARYWLPLLLTGWRFQGRFVFDQDNATALQITLVPYLHLGVPATLHRQP